MNTVDYMFMINTVGSMNQTGDMEKDMTWLKQSF